MGMRNQKALRNPELMAKWDVKGIYNEYGLIRTYCSCGHVSPNKLYVCPDCGNTEFTSVQNWDGLILSVPSKKIVFNPTDKTLVTNTMKLFVEKDTDPAWSILKEQTSPLVVFGNGSNRWTRNELPEDELLEAIYANAAKFNPPMDSIISIAQTLGLNYNDFSEFTRCEEQYISSVISCLRSLIRNKELNFAKVFAKRIWCSARNVTWTSMESLVSACGIPGFLKEERNNPAILNTFANGYYGGFHNWKTATDVWNTLPISVKPVIIHYLEQGLITSEQMESMPFISKFLLEDYPDIQSKIIKKYFANFSYRRSYRNDEDNSLDKMYQYYLSEELPISAETFDFRAWKSHSNSGTLKNSGYNQAEVDRITDNMDIDPIGSFLELGTLRRSNKIKV